jgi:outer membrane protein assembly factor BamB
VDRGQRLITVDGSGVYALDLAGQRVWTHPVPDPAPVVRQWGDAVLVTDPRRAWLLDAATGTQMFAADLAGAEEAAQQGADRSGPPAQINEVALSPDRAFVDVGTALIALDRTGRQLWRRPRPAASGTGQPSPSTPKVADRTRLVTQDLAGGMGQVGLYDTATGASRWSTRYALPPAGPAGPSRPPPPGAPGPPPVPDESWRRSESRLGPDFVALRDARDIQVVRVSDGRTVWKRSSVAPIAAIEVMGDLVVVSADKLTAWALADGAPAWQSPVRGARIAVSPDEHTVAVAAEGRVVGLDASGRTRWSAPLPEAVRGGLPERIGIDGRTAFITFRPRPDQPESLAADVIAVAVG